MFISIIIATHNRASSLSRTIESILTPSNVAVRDWELVVVDNGSTDETSDVLRAAAQAAPTHVRPVREPKAGKVNALNTGIRAARGEVLAMTDDDVIVGPGYLEAVRAVFARYAPDLVLGRVVLDLEGLRPAWFNDYFARLMSWRDLGDSVTEFQDGITGSNLVVRASAVRDIGGFCTDIGPGIVGTYEDSEFHRRLRRAGYRSIYSPDIAVRHQVPTERLTQRYFLRRAVSDGRSLAYIDPLKASHLRYGAYLFKDFIVGFILSCWYGLRRQPGRGLQRRCELLQRVGFFLQHCSFGAKGSPELHIPKTL